MFTFNSDAASMIRPANLRGLSADSTLIFTNGKRRHHASVIAFQGGGVNDGSQGADISVIPAIALKRVEVQGTVLLLNTVLMLLLVLLTLS